MAKREIKFGIIGCGLMGREFASAAARWCHLLDLDFVDEHQIDRGIKGIAHADVVLLRADERERARLFDQFRQAFDVAFGLATRNEIAQATDNLAGA